jgi:hypothetical protein
MALVFGYRAGWEDFGISSRANNITVIYIRGLSKELWAQMKPYYSGAFVVHVDRLYSRF